MKTSPSLTGDCGPLESRIPPAACRRRPHLHRRGRRRRQNHRQQTEHRGTAAESHRPGTGDTLQGVGNTPLIARIASITIKGDVFGSFTGGDHFGFVSQQIGKLKVGPRLLTLNAGPGNDSVPIPFTDDVRLLEVL